jgi:hypothetical protein
MSTSKLFQPIKVGKLNLSSRVVLAPLTRFRSDEKHVSFPIVKEYYAQRASEPGTLLINEATFIAAKAGGYAGAPGIWSPEQIKAWKEVSLIEPLLRYCSRGTDHRRRSCKRQLYFLSTLGAWACSKLQAAPIRGSLLPIRFRLCGEDARP